MLKKIIYTALLSLTVPATVFAEMAHSELVHEEENITTYLADHWHDVPLIILLVLASILAFRIAFLYGGIIGKALNLLSTGILILAVSDIIGNFLLHLINAEESQLHYGVDALQIVGSGLIAFAFWRLHAQTKAQFAVQGKK